MSERPRAWSCLSPHPVGPFLWSVKFEVSPSQLTVLRFLFLPLALLHTHLMLMTPLLQKRMEKGGKNKLFLSNSLILQFASGPSQWNIREEVWKQEIIYTAWLCINPGKDVTFLIRSVRRSVQYQPSSRCPISSRAYCVVCVTPPPPGRAAFSPFDFPLLCFPSISEVHSECGWCKTLMCQACTNLITTTVIRVKWKFRNLATPVAPERTSVICGQLKLRALERNCLFHEMMINC